MSAISDTEFFIVEAFRGIKRSGVMSFVAIGIVTVSIFIFGLFLLFIANLTYIVSNVGTRLDMVAYLGGNPAQETVVKMQNTFSNIRGVEEVRYVPKDEAWKKFREDFGQRLNLEDVIDSNPLPNSFAIKVKAPELLPSVAEDVAKYAEVSEVRYSGKLIKQMQNLVEAVRIGGLGLIILLFTATLLIVVNTIRLTVLARSTDISIMKLVGATSSFLRWPFVIEGVIIGVIGGMTGLFFLKALYELIIFRLQAALPFLPIIHKGAILTIIYLIVPLTGIILGMLGGHLSVSKILKSKE